MSEHRPHGPHDPEDPARDAAAGLDREIHVKTFFWFGAGLVVMTLISLAAMALLFRGLAHQAQRRDPAPSPIQEANERHLPPGPTLQTAPEMDLGAMRAAEEARLHSYGWVDESQGIAHIPIERAIEILAQRSATATTEVAPAPGTTPAGPSPASPAPSGEAHP